MTLKLLSNIFCNDKKIRLYNDIMFKNVDARIITTLLSYFEMSIILKESHL